MFERMPRPGASLEPFVAVPAYLPNMKLSPQCFPNDPTSDDPTGGLPRLRIEQALALVNFSVKQAAVFSA
jgi:hypothetical protein